MDVSCPSCSAEHELDDSQLPEDGVLVKCAGCAHEFRVQTASVPKQTDSASAPIPAAPPDVPDAAPKPIDPPRLLTLKPRPAPPVVEARPPPSLIMTASGAPTLTRTTAPFMPRTSPPVRPSISREPVALPPAEPRVGGSFTWVVLVAFLGVGGAASGWYFSVKLPERERLQKQAEIAEQLMRAQLGREGQELEAAARRRQEEEERAAMERLKP